MKRILAIARKEALHILRDPRSLTVAVLMPLLMLLLFGYAIDMDLKEIPVAIIDYDNTVTSRDLIREMTSSRFIVDAARLNNQSEVEPGFRQNRFRAALIIPVGYAESLIRNTETKVQILVDGADGSTAASTANYINQVIARLNQELAEKAFGKKRFPIEPRTRVWYNPEMVSANFVVPGLTAVIMMMICALLTSIALAREKETGTLEQILTTPITSIQVIVGKLAPYLVIASLDAILVLGAGKFIFHVPMNGSWWVLAGYSLIYLVIALAMGLLISTLVKTQQVAMMMALMATLLPTLLLSGFLFPVASMPKVLQYFSHIIPAMYYLKIIRGVMLKGVSLFPVEGGVLIFIAVFLTLVAVKRFKERLE